MDQRQRTRRGLLGAAVAGACPLPAWCAPGVLRVAALAIPPFGMIENGALRGVYVDIMARVAQETGLHIDQALAPRARADALVASGEADLTTAFDNARLLRNAYHVAPVSTLEVIVLGRAGTRYDSLAGLRGKTVGQIRSAEYDPSFMADQAIRKFETATLQQALGMLLEGRLDAVIGVRPSLLYTMHKEGLARTRFGDAMHVGELQTWLHYSARTYDAATAETLRACIMRLHANGTIAGIMKRYMNEI